MENGTILYLLNHGKYTGGFISNKELYNRIRFPTIVDINKVIKEQATGFLIKGNISLEHES
jgi:hypothetical protein